MNHFIYAMNSSDPAPASGGNTKSWFEYYKWDVDGQAYVPVKEDDLIGFEPGPGNVLWFVMDSTILGCVPIIAAMPTLSDVVELHYDTRLMQVAGGLALMVSADVKTGKAANQPLFDTLKRRFDAQHPPRNQAAAEGLPQATT